MWRRSIRRFSDLHCIVVSTPVERLLTKDFSSGGRGVTELGLHTREAEPCGVSAFRSWIQVVAVRGHFRHGECFVSVS